jgi:glycosyltransferase involved in cell wall biosynthesis
MHLETFREISSPEVIAITPRVSVYVAAYRHEKYLTEAVDSIMAQRTDFPVEVVIGEDCSPDGTLAVAVELQRKYPQSVRVIAGAGNVGGLRNSTRCLALCRGDFIAFCEGDDFWHDPHKLQIQIDIMMADANIMLCHTDYDRLIGRRRKRSMHARNPSPYLADGEAYVALLHEWTVMTVTSVYRASMIRDFLRTPFLRFDWPFGDYPKTLYASVRGSVVYVPRSTGTWRKVRGSLSNAGFAATLRLRLAAIECKDVFMEAFPVPENVRSSIRDKANRIIMHDAFYADDLTAYLQAKARCSSRARQHLHDWLRETGMRLRLPVLLARAYRQAVLRMTSHAL